MFLLSSLKIHTRLPMSNDKAFLDAILREIKEEWSESRDKFQSFSFHAINFSFDSKNR